MDYNFQKQFVVFDDDIPHCVIRDNIYYNSKHHRQAAGMGFDLNLLKTILFWFLILTKWLWPLTGDGVMIERYNKTLLNYNDGA